MSLKNIIRKRKSVHRERTVSLFYFTSVFVCMANVDFITRDARRNWFGQRNTRNRVRATKNVSKETMLCGISTGFFSGVLRFTSGLADFRDIDRYHGRIESRV